MEFMLSEEQRMLQDSVAGFLESSCPLDRVRQIADAEQTIAGDVHDGLVGLGIPGILIPEDFGGVGLGFLEAALVAESLGYVVAPVPFSASSIMAPVALLNAGSDAQQEHWLPKIAAGEVTIAVGIKEQIGRRETNGVYQHPARTLTGKAMFVLEAMEADAYLIADSFTGLLYLVGADADGLSRTKAEDHRPNPVGG